MRRRAAAGVSFELRRRDSTRRMAAQGPRKAAQLRPAAARDRKRRRGTDSGGAGPTGSGSRCVQRRKGVQPAAARVRPAAAQRRPTSGGYGLPRRRRIWCRARRRRRLTSAADLALRATTVRRRLTSSDGAATVHRRCGGSPAVVAESLRRWSRRVSGGGGGLAVKMGLEVKWVWSSENGFGGR
ncbi:hypothetical protein Scep_019784 [Stephania cephalantha]|uniref:Uncharacterized protein n=1 Tax=Stephania cephalantha TaxID=152367 RepID=A0AAP0IBJ5_9MAGN